MVNMIEVYIFIGLVYYYCYFLTRFPFADLYITRSIQKEVPFVWNDDNGESFQKLRTLLTSAPILTFLIECNNFFICCDALQSALGIVLMQDKNMISYSTRQLKLYEKNYPSQNLE